MNVHILSFIQVDTFCSKATLRSELGAKPFCVYISRRSLFPLECISTHDNQNSPVLL